jgi:hypothetical protein
MTGDMFFQRCFHNSVVLANGDVVVIGGQTSSAFAYTSRLSVYFAEIWSPLSRQFRVLESPRVSIRCRVDEGWARMGIGRLQFHQL